MTTQLRTRAMTTAIAMAMTRTRLATMVAAMTITIACEKTNAKDRPTSGPMEYPVEVSTVRSEPVEYVHSAVGSVEAFERVQVTARVPGVVEHVRFTEGQLARKGQLLVEIDPERYRLAVDSGRASLERAEAASEDARTSLSRREAIIATNTGLIPMEEIESWRTKVRTSIAEVQAAKAALGLAEINLKDAFVRSPVTGTIQTRTVVTGQYVQPGALMTTLIQRDPLLLRFKVPEDEATGLARGMQVGFHLRNNERRYTATITHVTETAEEASRMVTVTAEIDDARKATLRPGAFAEVTTSASRATEMPVIPQTAVRPSERGFLGFVVEDGIAKERVLTLGMRTKTGLVEVKGGLKSGESLVVRGAEALRDGARVVSRAASGAPAP